MCGWEEAWPEAGGLRTRPLREADCGVRVRAAAVWRDSSEAEATDLRGFTQQVFLDFPGGAVVKTPPANAEDTGSRPGPGRSHMPQSN